MKPEKMKSIGKVLLTVGIILFSIGLICAMIMSVSPLGSALWDTLFDIVPLFMMPGVLCIGGSIPLLIVSNIRLRREEAQKEKEFNPDGYCHKCGAPRQKDDTFCSKCGNKLN